jgi:transposase
MSYARKPRDEERKELRRMTRQEVGRVCQRAQMVLLDDQGWIPTEIAEIFGTCAPTVRSWLNRFSEEGPAGLYDEPRSGRPCKVTGEVVESIDTMIRQDPAQQGYLATFWTVAMLILAVFQKLGLALSPRTMRLTLRKMDLRWGRPRLAMPYKVDPQKAYKQWLIVKAMIDAAPDAAILYADESRVQLLPLIRAMWHWVGQQVRVPTPGTNDWRGVFGALDIHTGLWTYLVRTHIRKEDFIAFLEHLLVVYPTQSIVLIVDSYSSHTAGVVKEWLAEHQRLRMLYLPTHCSQLNPVEQIWLQMKGKIAADRLHASMQGLLDTVTQFFNDMSPQQALKWASVSLK